MRSRSFRILISLSSAAACVVSDAAPTDGPRPTTPPVLSASAGGCPPLAAAGTGFAPNAAGMGTPIGGAPAQSITGAAGAPASPPTAAGASGAPNTNTATIGKCPVGYDCIVPPTQTELYCVTTSSNGWIAPPSCIDQAMCSQTLPGGQCMNTPIGALCTLRCVP